MNINDQFWIAQIKYCKISSSKQDHTYTVKVTGKNLPIREHIIRAELFQL